jgi:Protein of unknown function (DUF3037)
MSVIIRPDGRHPFEYAAIRLLPRVDRGESINTGVIVYCQALDYLEAGFRLDQVRVLALDPAADLAGIGSAVAAYADVCRGGQAAGQAGNEPPGRRFRWLTAPRSTVVQPGPVHIGLTADPAAMLKQLMGRLLG